MILIRAAASRGLWRRARRQGIRNAACKHSHACRLTGPEIRNEVYAYYIDKTSVDYVRNWRFFSRRGCLPLAQTCKQIHQEFISFFRSQTPVRTQLSLLNRYLRTYYPLGNNRSRGAALLHLILPNNADRSEPVVPYTDITHLFVLMARNAHFTCTFEQASANNEQAVAESQELQDLLRDVSLAAKPMLDSIFSVRLVMAKEGNFWNPTIKATKHRRPVVWFVFKEHATLPGEWPPGTARTISTTRVCSCGSSGWCRMGRRVFAGGMFTLRHEGRAMLVSSRLRSQEMAMSSR